MAPTVPIEFAGQKESRKFSLSQVMGKSRKYSKGYATGFVPDFRHAVETMGESEGFGSSGRVDTELTASEDSCAPKRKCLSLNVAGYDSLGVPFQVWSLSKMSQSERKELKLRLKLELEQVRKLQKKVASMNADILALSPTSDIRSCTDGQKRPPLETHHRSLETSISHGKKRPPPGRNGPKTKRSNSGRFESVKPVAQAAASNAMLMKQCDGLLKRLMSHQFGWVFNAPVDVVKLNIPDYFTVIKEPMDLGTVKSRITSGEYSSPLDFAADVRLTFSNAMTYNPPGNDVHVMAESLSKYFEMRWKPIEKKITALDSVPSEPSRPADSVETEISDRIPPSRKKKITPNDTSVKLDPVKRFMTVEEKNKLSTELEGLLQELPEPIVDFLKEQSCNASINNDDEVEIDIDALSDDTLFKLRKLLDDYILEKQKIQANVGPTEIELLNESGFSNSSMQLCKGFFRSFLVLSPVLKSAGNDPVEEDVDIVGGDDPPVSSYPPVEILKDGANKKSSSSSSSSSESGSSSSGSNLSSDIHNVVMCLFALQSVSRIFLEDLFLFRLLFLSTDGSRTIQWLMQVKGKNLGYVWMEDQGGSGKEWNGPVGLDVCLDGFMGMEWNDRGGPPKPSNESCVIKARGVEASPLCIAFEALTALNINLTNAEARITFDIVVSDVIDYAKLDLLLHISPYYYSDSGSSSGSESDTAKASEPLNATKDNAGSGLTTDKKKGDLGNSEVGKESVNDSGQVGQSFQSKPTVEPESCLEGETESAPSGRQVSPDKLYRAALLRSRFADTILKAREKALEKGEKLDPEKLKIEREELERRQKEEKARLQAEAKAAEEARRKAEAEAAAEAKRKRELEREAAREALQKMEKTVDINENSQFFEDLEMLRAVNDEHLPSFTEDTNPDQLENGLGSFKLQGSNPLEQLGLYMKEDDEEEEEELPPSASGPGPANDVEEGEID
ncbi:transcription factor GTE10-like [Senna tora]|uniref:Transcription factor GTE10-like n=1 Tax=Senna tora TaxID=362788 RepID=A0A835CDC6_9FABA|nr:transcription factor GTE10-like [Senna tora]